MNAAKELLRARRDAERFRNVVTLCRQDFEPHGRQLIDAATAYLAELRRVIRDRGIDVHFPGDKP